MKALVYHSPGKKSWEEKPKPVITEPTDAILKVLKTTICGTDLHILKGDVPTVADGRILGHEGVGIIEEAGNSVTRFKKGGPCSDIMYNFMWQMRILQKSNLFSLCKRRMDTR